MTSQCVTGSAKANEPCKINTDCATPYELCDGGICTHKNLFPLLGTEFYGLLIVICCLTFTNTGGLGGAGIIIPIMLGRLYQFDARNAVSLSNSSITASGLTRYFTNLSVKHPLKNGTGTQTDYNITILMLPGLIIGSSIGSIVNLSLPGPIIIVGFILGNFYIAFVGLRNFTKIRRKEKDMSSVSQ